MTLKWLKDTVHKEIATETLRPTLALDYLQRTEKLLGSKEAIKEYKALVCLLMSHEYSGIELLGNRIGNGSLLYNGETFDSLVDLRAKVLTQLGLDACVVGSLVFWKLEPNGF